MNAENPRTRIEITESPELRALIWAHLPVNASQAKHRVESHYFVSTPRTYVIFSFDPDIDSVLEISVSECVGRGLLLDDWKMLSIEFAGLIQRQAKYLDIA